MSLAHKRPMTYSLNFGGPSCANSATNGSTSIKRRTEMESTQNETTAVRKPAREVMVFGIFGSHHRRGLV